MRECVKAIAVALSCSDVISADIDSKDVLRREERRFLRVA